ncbi:TonB-dependent receptor [Tsuneonella flava]|uniref:TonB-dependent receptor n=1 Tax=Tsuneonella flava TaxID=2055955 RepID=A0ABX7K995_9SPHN|nr:TonB-dependent receptor [Tsuneonella flava]QSB44488.1 TonB-dependent receptor [Tsuneonella flava]
MARRVSLGVSTVIIGYLCCGSTAQAQEKNPEAQTADSEIVVTALKRSESAQRIPASISAVSGEALEQQGILDVRDIAKIIPNLNWGEHLGTTLITIRGVGSNVESGVTEPTVAMYVDGTFLPRSTMATLRAIDLDRVEVLRGPQGTLYGRNATGGAINFISAKPTRTLSGRVELSAGGRNERGISGFVSGPITDGVYFRLSGGREKQDGFIKVLNTGQTIGGVDANYFRAAARLEPLPNLTIDLSYRFDRNTAPVAIQQLIDPSPLAPPSGQTTEPNRIVADGPFRGYSRTSIASGTINWEASDHLTIRSITSHVSHLSDLDLDGDATSTPFYDVINFNRPSKSFSQELSLVGESGRLSFILGGFYFHEDAQATLPLVFGAVGGPASSLPAGAVLSQGVVSETSNLAAFVDATYKITDAFRLNLGLRYNHENNDYTQRLSIDPVLPLTSVDLHTSTNKLLPKVALQFDLAPDVSSYLQWSRGFKSGGANWPGSGGELFGPTLGLYQPEQLDAYELGFKSRLLGRRLTANFAAFYYDYQGLQITQVVPPNTTLISNANARIYGLEADLQFQVTDAFRLQLAPTFMHARYKDFVSIDPVYNYTANLDGSPLTRAPDFTLNGSATYRAELGGELLSALILNGSVYHSSRTVLRYYNNPGESQAPYTTANLSATLEDASGKTRLSLFVHNLFDETYLQNIINFGLGRFGNYAPPRTWGVRLVRDF